MIQGEHLSSVFHNQRRKKLKALPLVTAMTMTRSSSSSIIEETKLTVLISENPRNQR